MIGSSAKAFVCQKSAQIRLSFDECQKAADANTLTVLIVLEISSGATKRFILSPDRLKMARKLQLRLQQCRHLFCVPTNNQVVFAIAAEYYS